jgi:hypothetical protein
MGNRLNEPGQMLVDDLEDMIRRVHQGNCSELIRKAAQAGLDDAPVWAELKEDGKTPTGPAREKLSYRLRRASSVPPWEDVRAIVVVSVRTDELGDVLARFAELWRRSTGQLLPEKYADEFRRMGGELRAPRHLSLDELWSETQQLRADVQQLRAELADEKSARTAAEQSSRLLRAELTKAKPDNSKNQFMRFAEGLQSAHLEIGQLAERTQYLTEENERLLQTNELLVEKLYTAEKNAFEATKQLREVLGNRVHDAEKEVVVLGTMYDFERDLRELLAHSAAMHTAFAGTSVRLQGTGIPNLPLPDVIVLATAPDLDGHDPMTATFISYLRAFLLNMYGTDRTHPDIPRQHLDRIIRGELPDRATLHLLLQFHPALRDPVYRMYETAAAVKADVDRDVPALANLPLLSLLSDTINLSDGSLDLMEGVEGSLTGGHGHSAKAPVDELTALTMVIPIAMPMQRVG